jgi:hypothetical protein
MLAFRNGLGLGFAAGASIAYKRGYGKGAMVLTGVVQGVVQGVVHGLNSDKDYLPERIADLELKKLPKTTQAVYEQFKDKNGILPHIIKNKCVHTIHKLFGILSAGNNVFIDFMEDTRPTTDKQTYFTDTLPYFVIQIRELPRKTLAATDDTCVTVTFTAPDNVRNGVYVKLGTDTYIHTEQSGYILEYDTTQWISYEIDESTPPRPKNPLNFGPSGQDELLTNFKTGNIIVTPGTPIITQNYDDILTMPSTTATKDLPDEYVINGTKYKKIGTIYKSIYHDHYYKYCKHGQRNELFFDCSKEDNVPDIDARMTKENMFAFIRLYEKEGLDYSKYTVANHPFLYPDIIKFKDNNAVNTLFNNITSEFK